MSKRKSYSFKKSNSNKTRRNKPKNNKKKKNKTKNKNKCNECAGHGVVMEYFKRNNHIVAFEYCPKCKGNGKKQRKK